MYTIIHNDNKVIIAFINSKDEVEYTEYKAIDGGTIDTEREHITIVEKLLNNEIITNDELLFSDITLAIK